MATNEELIIKIKADTDKATKEINRLNKEVGNLSKNVGKNNKTLATSKKSFDSVAKSTASFNKQLVGLATTYLSFQGAKQLITTTAEVEGGFIGIAKTTGLVGKEFAKLETALLDMSTSMAGVELSGLQSVAETAGQLGITGVDNILEFTRVITMMGTATDLTAEQAATSMAKLGNSLDVPVTEFERLGSVINELSNNTTATAENLVNMGQRIAGVGKTFGLTADEVLAFSATLTDVGMSAELGGTALSTVMLQMLKDTEAFAKASGVSFEEFSKLIEDEPVKALELFIQSIGKLDKSAKIKALDELGLKSSGVTQTMLKLSGATDNLTKNLKLSGDEWIRNTSLQKEYETAASGLEAQWSRVENALTVLGYKIGKELLPVMKELIDNTVLWVDSLDDDAIASFGQGIGKLFEGLVGLGKTVAFLNDILMPDWIGGEGAGFFDTAIDGWSRLGDMISKTSDALDAIEGASQLSIDVSEVDAAVQSFDGLNTTYEKLSTTLQGLLAENLKLQETFRNNGSAEAQAQLAALVIEEEKLMRISMDLAQQKPLDSTTQSANEAAGAVATASGKVQELKQLTLNGMTLTVTADTTPADFGLQQFIVSGEGEELTVRTTAEWQDAEKEIDALRKAEEKDAVEVPIKADDKSFKKDVESAKSVATKTPVTVKVDADTKTAEASIKKVKEPTTSKHKVIADTSSAQAAINVLKRPTFSTHTVTIREVRARAEGGVMPQRLATGGTFTGAGRVPGYDPTDSDKVNAVLSGGEFVIKRSAVDAIGVATLNAINSFKMPKLPGFADGGLVGSASTATSSSPALAPINLNIGGQTFGMMGDRDVAEALHRFIENEGGL